MTKNILFLGVCLSLTAVRADVDRLTCALGEGVRGWISMPRPAWTARDAIVDRLDFVRFGVPLQPGVRPTDVKVELALLRGDKAKTVVDWTVADGFLLVDVTDSAKDGSKYLVDAAKSRVSFAAAKAAVPAAPAVPPLAKADDDWAGRARHLAVVNAAVPTDDGSVLSLRGNWDFAFCDYDFAARIHSFNRQDRWPGERTVRVPGCWEAQGVGGPSNQKTSYTYPGVSAMPLRHRANGSGWYRKTVTLPVGWTGQRIWLKTGGVRARGRFWVNDVPVARLDDYVGTWKFEITDLVRPGEPVKVVAEVSNYFGNRNAQLDTYSRWGGIWRDVELEATPQTYIDEAWVRGDFDMRLAEAHVEVAGMRDECRGKRLRVTVEGDSRELSLHSSTSTSNFDLEVPLRNFRPWSPEQPNLYTAKVELVSADGKVLQTRFERFGVRKLEARGNKLYLNGKPFYVRSFGDDSVYPLTGLTPADRDFHLRHLLTARAAGFNFVRTHTHVEIDEYFQAADEAGVMVQPELSYLHDEACGFFPFDACRDAAEMHWQLRRHPSFAVYSGGNEGWLGEYADRKLYRFIKALDPDRLVVNQDGGRDNTYGTSDLKSGPMSVWERGAYEPGLPFVAHEYLNLTVKCDPRLEKDYTGVLAPPATMAARRSWLEKGGLGPEWVGLLQDAQHALQAWWQKTGIEQARLDPFCDGYCYWTLVDYIGPTQDGVTCSANGFLDPFWRTKKGGWSLDEFTQFNSSVGVFVDTEPAKTDLPLALSWNRCLFDWPAEECYRYVDRERAVYVSGEKLPVAFHLDNYGEGDIENAELSWRFGTASGRKPLGALTLGGIRRIFDVEIAVPDVSAACRSELTFDVTGSVDGRPFRVGNSRPFWVFPRREIRKVSGVAAADSFRGALSGRYEGLEKIGASGVRTVIVAADSAEEMAAMQTVGVNVVSLSYQSGKPNDRLGWWFAENQVGTAFKPHAILKRLPYEPSLSPLWFRIVREPQRLPVEGLDPADVIAAGEGKDYLGLYLSESRTVSGGRHIRVTGLDVLTDTPEGTALLDGILDHLEGESYQK